MDLQVWITFVAASCALMLVPGPAMLFMIGTALNDGLPRALAAMPGLVVGLLASMLVSLMGAGAVLLASAELFTALKFAGAAYLIYLGVRLWRTKPQTAETRQGVTGDRSNLFWSAFLVAFLNPKALIFHIAFLPQFVDPTRPAALQFGVLITTFAIIALAAAVISAIAGSGLRRGAKSAVALKVLNRAGAGAMVTSGVVTLTATRGQ